VILRVHGAKINWNRDWAIPGVFPRRHFLVVVLVLVLVLDCFFVPGIRKLPGHFLLGMQVAMDLPLPKPCEDEDDDEVRGRLRTVRVPLA
jgi:hypothetical protein